MKNNLNIKQEIEIFKEKMRQVESLICTVKQENKVLQICFANLMKLMNHELVNSLNQSSKILENFKIEK